MELATILLRTAFMYVFVFFMLRLMGKREIGKLSVFDMVISIMIAEIAVISIESPDRSIWATVGPIVLLVIIQLLLAYISLKSHRIRTWFDGKPSVLIRSGRLNVGEMKKQRYNLDDLMTQLRENKLDSVADVELAVLESDGKLSVLPKDKPAAGSFNASETRPSEEDALSKIRFELLPITLIMDGKVMDENLEKLDKTRFWLKKELRAKGIRSFDEVFLCSIDHNGKLFVGRKSD